MLFEHNDEPIHVMDEYVRLSNTGAHVLAYPFFDNHPSYRGKINWLIADDGYIRGLPY